MRVLAGPSARPRARAARERNEKERETRPERPVSAANKSGNGAAAWRGAITYPRTFLANRSEP